jgi:uncharacterized protein (TIGR03083 family)
MIQTLHLFRPLNQKLLELLRELSAADWSRKTPAGAWTVKDVAAHLLDGSLRVISLYRDRWELPPPAVTDYRSLVTYLNQLNGEWVTATKRLSPQVLIEWLESTHESYIRCFEELDLNAPARFSVAWAGESVSTNAFHIAREYTEKWHHQQQIRAAVGKQGILSKMFYQPVLETFFQALPHAFRDTPAPEGTRVVVSIEGDAGADWYVRRDASGWRLADQEKDSPDLLLSIPGELAWKLFTKAVSPESARQLVTLTGQEALAWPVLRMLSVMA